MTQTSALHPSSHLINSLGFTLNYARALLTDVSEDQFAHLPMEGFNHPAFCYGHLACYPGRMLGLMGQEDQTLELPFESSGYEHGSECVEQDGRYAPMPVLVDAFFAGHERLIEVLPTVAPEVFAQPIGLEGRIAEMFPRIGDAIDFMSGNHMMMHLGQVSMWRRAMGLGPCM